MSHSNKLDLQAVSTEDAHPLAKPVLEGAKNTLGFVPNMYSYFANSPALLKSYTDTYNLFRHNTDFNGVEQEVVF
jgi:hypothetical protein